MSRELVLFFTAGMSLRKWAKAGILTREVALYNELAKHFDKIYFLTYGDKHELQYKSFLADNIEILYNNTGLGDALYTLIAPIIHRNALIAADYYKTNQLNGSWTAAIAKALYGKKLVVRQGYPWLKTLKGGRASIVKIIIATIAEKLAYRVADKIIVTTVDDKVDIILHHPRTPPERIEIIPNCVNTDVFKPLPLPPEFNKQKLRLIYVGRFAPEKNLVNLIDAVKTLSVELCLVGGGDLNHKLHQKVADEGIENVIFTGSMQNNELPGMLSTGDIFIMPSWYEGNPKALLEAMACGLPVIGSETRGIVELVHPGKTGYLCGLTAQAIKEAICQVLADGEEKRKAIGQNARDFVLSNYSLEVILRKELEVYAAIDNQTGS